MDLIHAILAGLAGWRVAALLVNEAGPFDVSVRIRSWAGLAPRGGFLAPKPFVGGLLSCVWCASVWTAGGFYALGVLVSWPCVAAVAAMAVAVWMEQQTKR